jgi:hypothetical protein
MKARLSRLLCSRAFVVVAALLAIVLLLPALRAGFMMDDYSQILWLRGGPHATGGPRGVWDMFRFQDGGRATFRQGLDAGFWPWWSNPDLRLAFLRPVTSLTHAIDHWLFRDSPALMRLESILMYGAAVAIVGAAYRRVLGATVACGLALLMYALDDGHAVTVTWISNRNAVLAAAFGFGALVLHDRAVRSSDRRARLAAPLVLALGLLSGEAALGALGYIAAHALWLQEDRLGARLKALAPYLVVLAAWVAVYKLGGYGAGGSEFYIDPGREPARFGRALAMRLPVLLHGQFGFPPSDLWLMVPFEKQTTVLPFVVAAVLAGAAVLVFGVRRSRENGFFATGMLLSLVPVCAVIPSDRLLMFAGFGAFGLIGDFLTAPRELMPHARRVLVRVAGGFFVLVHLVAAPFLFAARGVTNARMLHEPIERVAASLPPSSEMAGKTLVLVNAPDVLTPAFGIFVRARRGEPMPARIRQLAVAVEGRAMVRRTGERSLEITLTKGFFHEAFSHVYRPVDQPIALGDRFEVAGMAATVKAFTSNRQRAGTIEFAFDEALDGGSFVWVLWKGTRFERFELPAVGEEREIEVVDYMTAMQGP